MMKNSKLSKLLVAGVSVAMLASALAPMAFAEESGLTEAESAQVNNLTIYVRTFKADAEGNYNTSTGEVKAIDWTKTNAKDTTKTWTEYFEKGAAHRSVAGYKVAKDDPAGEYNYYYDESTFDLSDLVFNAEYTWNGVGTYANDNWPDKRDVAAVYNFPASGSISIEDLKKGDTTTKNVYIDLVVNEVDYATVKADTVSNGSITKYNYGTTSGTNVALTDDIAVPYYKADDGYYVGSIDAEITIGGAKWKTLENLTSGTTFNLKALGINSNKETVVVEFKNPVKAVEKLHLQLDSSAYVLSDKGVQTKKDSTTVQGVNPDDIVTFKEYDDNGKVVAYGETVVLPTVQAVKNSKVVESLVFDHWEVDKDSNAILSTGTAAKKYVIADGIFDPTDFKADGNPATQTKAVKLVAVFVENSTTKYTYDKFETPNDTVWKYDENGKKVAKVTYDQMMKEVSGDKDFKFEGGAFLNEKTDVVSYYIKGDTTWIVDTTVNGLVDGVYFADGKQDTEAYGLKKVSGAAEDDKFFYLVSDGLYVDDYTGIWVDEDGSIYNLINGCTSDVPFTGIVEKDGWATSVKDSKVDDKANGFILYGKTQYWFINGTCNLNETEAVREHTDGNFYYTVGAKIDFTFNGECNGHTFVNGVASK